MLAVGAVAGGVRQPDAPVATTSTSPVPQQAGALMVGADVAANIRALQSRLSTVPRTGQPGRAVHHTSPADLAPWARNRAAEASINEGVPRRGFLGAAQ